MTLHISLLGAFSVRLEDQRLDQAFTPRLQLLLALLVIKRGVSQSRESLAATIWPDRPAAAATGNLRTLVHRLRAALPESDELLEVTSRSIAWRDSPKCSIDVHQFDAAAQSPDQVQSAQRIIQLYGELLPGLANPWLEDERQRLKKTYVRSLDSVARLHEVEGRYESALELARRRVAAEPLIEDHHRTVIRLCGMVGDKAGARKAFDACERVLNEVLEERPDALTREALSAALSARAEQRANFTESAVPLIGRAAPLRMLQSIWEGAAGTASKVALIEGDAGIGKTRLAEVFSDWVARQGAEVVWARAYEPDQGKAYAAVTPWIRAGFEKMRSDQAGLARSLALVLPDLLPGSLETTATDGLHRPTGRDALHKVITRTVMAPGGPVLLILDDLQWADDESVAWLQGVIRSAPGFPLLFLLTIRSGDRAASKLLRSLCLEFSRSNSSAIIRLEALSKEESDRLAAELLGPGGGASRLSVHEEAEGNPLFITELVRLNGGSRRQAGTEEGERHDGAAELPVRITSVLQGRLDQLGPDERLVVEAGAVLRRPFSHELVASVSSLEHDAAAKALDGLCQAGILEETTDGFCFHHHLLAREAYRTTGPIRRQRLHRKAAEAVLTGPAGDRHSSEAASHYERGGVFDAAMRHYINAAERDYRLGASGGAITTLQHALSIANHCDDVLVASALERLGDLYHLTARYADAREHLEAAIGKADKVERRAGLYRKIAKTYTGQRNIAATLKHLDIARGILEASDSREDDWWVESIQVGLERLAALYWTGDWQTMGEVGVGLDLLLEQHGTPAQRRHRSTLEIGMRLRRDRQAVSPEMVTLARYNLGGALAGGEIPIVAVAHFQLGMLLLLSREYDDAEHELGSALRSAEADSDQNLRSRCLTYLAILYRMRRLPGQAIDFSERALESAIELGSAEYKGAAHANLGWGFARRKRYSEARDHCLQALSEWARPAPDGLPFPFQWLALFPLIALESRDGTSGDSLGECVGYVERLLDTSQTVLAPSVTHSLEMAASLSRNGNGHPQLRKQLLRIVTLAEDEAYL